jgi:hypothetical protein
MLGKEIGQHSPIQIGDTDNRFQAANGQDQQSENDPGLQLRNLEAVAEGIGNGG